ncbi:HI0074 family nucleotidyltransferase substrate-binding subunit [Anaerovoracaceae bacterium 41-7]|jgi:nucleotidyltransferase substrate binding protein (TIGR01987 family)|uniref:HI0074 family nucleotidyltransferase substrate-binding subunit n=1 Tax=Anaerovoracaceae TaxID=543314 RepID=UPI00137A285A|nr:MULTISPECIES: HI0074 family nucleotidyltransferase substrate-binding subunit [Clostridia]MCI9476391.1 nucleotidyltransferase [Emergencia sp.]NCE99696.1 nucleotidyltransferase [Emergencia sp. 1XD21-10]
MKKYENFCKALENLQDVFLYEPPYNSLVVVGSIKLYEICFELAWKAMKEILTNQGFEDCRSGSPKQVVKVAYKAGLVTDEEVWLSALSAKNNVSHAYNEAVALDIIDKTKNVYCSMFRDLKEQMQKWI